MPEDEKLIEPLINLLNFVLNRARLYTNKSSFSLNVLYKELINNKFCKL